MGEKVLAALLITATAFTSLLKAPRVSSQTDQYWDTDLPVREEINERYQLSTDAPIKISFINGSVEVETANITTAEVHVVRSARNQADLGLHKIIIEHTQTSLVVRGEQWDDRQPQGIEVRQHVRLKIPRQAALSINNISGSVKVGDLDAQLQIKDIGRSVMIESVGDRVEVRNVSRSVNMGSVDGQAVLSNVSGSVTVGRIRGHLDVSDVSGGLFAMIALLDDRGLLVRRVSGSVELLFKEELNAYFNARHLSGRVYFDVPNVSIQGDPQASDFGARIGRGGSPISVSNISGIVRLRRT